jgi:hypothetical protein
MYAELVPSAVMSTVEVTNQPLRVEEAMDNSEKSKPAFASDG